MIDDEYSEVLVENQFSFIEVDVVDVTVGLVLGVPLNQVVECGFDLARVVVDNDRVSVDHGLPEDEFSNENAILTLMSYRTC